MNKNVLKWITLIIGTVLILTISGLIIFQLQNNDQANQQVIEKCFENFSDEVKVTFEQNNIWTTVTCENE